MSLKAVIDPQISARPRRRALLVRAACSAAVLAGALVVAGCGFKLRGSFDLPFKSLYLPTSSPSMVDMRRYLTRAGVVKVTDTAQQAEARVDVLLDVREKEIVAFSSTGTPREYQLRQRFRFRLVDEQYEEWLPIQEIVLRREVTTTDAELLAKQQEDIVLYQDMQSDLVQQVLRRLAAAPPRQRP